jgi:hypothetical protein
VQLQQPRGVAALELLGAVLLGARGVPGGQEVAVGDEQRGQRRGVVLGQQRTVT